MPASRELLRDPDLQQVAPKILSSGAASTSTSRAEHPRQAESAGDQRQGRRLQAGEDDDEDQYHVEEELAPADASAAGWLPARSGRTAKPGPGRKTCSRDGILKTPTHKAAPTTAGRRRSGRGRLTNATSASSQADPPGEGQQPEHDEQPDLGDPADALDECSGWPPGAAVGRCPASARTRTPRRSRWRGRGGQRCTRTPPRHSVASG